MYFISALLQVQALSIIKGSKSCFNAGTMCPSVSGPVSTQPRACRIIGTPQNICSYVELLRIWNNNNCALLRLALRFSSVVCAQSSLRSHRNNTPDSCAMSSDWRLTIPWSGWNIESSNWQGHRRPLPGQCFSNRESGTPRNPWTILGGTKGYPGGFLFYLSVLMLLMFRVYVCI